jgi:hypothetical protein
MFNCDICYSREISFNQIIDYLKLYPVVPTAQNQDFMICAVFGIKASNLRHYHYMILLITHNDTVYNRAVVKYNKNITQMISFLCSLHRT